MTAIPHRNANSLSTPALANARTRLIGYGALMLAIYIMYVAFYPLIPHTANAPGPALDLEMLMRGQNWRAIPYLIGLLALFYAYWQTMRAAHTLATHNPSTASDLRLWILGAGILFGLVLLFLYPITALDVFLYVVRGRLWAVHGESPMFALPETYPTDPYIGFAGEFADEVSPYGPLWELIAQIPLRLGLVDMVGGTLAMKVIALLAYALTAWLIGWRAHQSHTAYPVSGLVALTFFAWNPLVLLQAIGNGHNDMLMLALITLGLVLWQRGRWRFALFALTLAVLIKITALILLPLFGLAVVRAAPTWRDRFSRVLQMALIFFITVAIFYRLTGEFPEVFDGVRHALLGRRGFAPTDAFRMVFRELIPQHRRWIELTQSAVGRDLFIAFYAYQSIRLISGKTTLFPAAYLTYFGLLMLSTPFRIWYPLWIVPLAALHLTSRTWWRTALFSFTAELSIFCYFVIWRWLLRSLPGAKETFGEAWNYWTVMTLLVVPWAFGIPLLAPILRKRRDPARFTTTLWL